MTKATFHLTIFLVFLLSGHFEKSQVYGNILTTVASNVSSAVKSVLPSFDIHGDNNILTMIGSNVSNAVKRVLSFFDIQSDDMSLLEILLSVFDLYRQNITVIVPECYNRNNGSLVELQHRLLNEPKKCLFDPFKKIGQNVNGTVSDVKAAVRAVGQYFKNIDTFGALLATLKLGTEESMLITDLEKHVNVIVNSTLDLVLVPLCFVGEAADIAIQFSTEFNETASCIKEELAKNRDC